MGCCAPGAELALLAPDARGTGEEVLLASRIVADGVRQTDLSVPTVHCGACIRTIETALGGLAGVESARVNLSTRRVTVRWRSESAPPPFLETLKQAGFAAHLFDIESDDGNSELSELIRALAVAGFAASNIMLLSVSVWSGAESETRDLFHWLSAIIALPALAYSGRIFFRSAWRALRHRRTNMDVPISIGVLLAFGMSLYDTTQHGPYAYFDASISLLFFLLIGRTLDHMMRERARLAVKGLAQLAARGARVLQADGKQIYLPVNEIQTGMTIMLAAGERVPVDATVIKGTSGLDASLISGEQTPVSATIGSLLRAGTLNLTGPLTIVATATPDNSFLGEMVRMMEAAEQGRSAYRRIADRAASLYAPIVHLTALFALAGWLLATGDIHRALTIAIAVLIITCPCALGLAVPMVQVVAARRLFESGIMVKDGGALERLAEIDTVVFDKTGTLTLGRPRLIGSDSMDREAIGIAAALASHSRHPYSRALVEAAADLPTSRIVFDEVSEHPGFGLEARSGVVTYRLGRPEWALASRANAGRMSGDESVVLSKGGHRLAEFRFEDFLRANASTAVTELENAGILVQVVSGDREAAVAPIARQLNVPCFAAVLPAGKIAHIAALEASGRKVLMVGDGLNDAPALVAAHASMAPATAADIGRNAADLVFLRESLSAVPQAISVARNARRLVRQNFALAIAYNLVAVPVAIMGYVTPLVAAVAMSASSMLVVANALRLRSPRRIVPRAVAEAQLSAKGMMEAAE
ncbi:cation-translocating P-type ATPase [Bradyrhizobium sp. AUGA SZCCT0431]|uniref:cation-translocating P-type ATPase n=1 Tax=Bradyrhizobium sp. AUGA SZCCT0431 TaxID=2807674 RepID=UPI001BAB0306|nr:cation-translocating P-type ATPase [Bradyrhizobium sp. AUGA SZCCT0431]MBR1148784.1 cadmium-translocating P-type ATPase [Bradyrhizobium sp. AUGA SZCCT0431]